MCLFIIYTSSLNVSYYNKTRLLEKVDIIVRHTRRRRKEKISLSLFNVYSSARDDDSREQKKRSKNAYSGEDIFALCVLKEFFLVRVSKNVFVMLCKRARQACVSCLCLWRIFCLFSSVLHSQQKTTRERERERWRENCHTHTT